MSVLIESHAVQVLKFCFSEKWDMLLVILPNNDNTVAYDYFKKSHNHQVLDIKGIIFMYTIEFDLPGINYSTVYNLM